MRNLQGLVGQQEYRLTAVDDSLCSGDLTDKGFAGARRRDYEQRVSGYDSMLIDSLKLEPIKSIRVAPAPFVNNCLQKIELSQITDVGSNFDLLKLRNAAKKVFPGWSSVPWRTSALGAVIMVAIPVDVQQDDRSTHVECQQEPEARTLGRTGWGTSQPSVTVVLNASPVASAYLFR
jgi:hypothetical protein